MTSPSKRNPQKEPGFAIGKRVWFKQEWDAVLAAKRLGHGDGVIAQKDIATMGGAAVRLAFADGTEGFVPERLLRLTPPPGHVVKREQGAKERRPKARKEAVKPEYGTELTIYDALEKA